MSTIKLNDIDIYALGDSIQLTGAIYSDANSHMLCFLPGDAEPDNRIDTLDMDVDDWKRFMHQLDVVEQQVLSKDQNGELYKAILRKSQRQIEQQLSWRVFRRDGYACRWCGAADQPLSVDHLIPFEVGGPTIDENLVSSCKKCNRKRGNMLLRDWLLSPRYIETSKRLMTAQTRANQQLLNTITTIPLVITQRSR